MIKHTFGQALVIAKKNLTILRRQSQFWVNLYVPLMCGLLSLASIYTRTLASLSLLQPFYQTLAMNGLIRSSATIIISDRVERQKETQKIMGLNQSSYFIGWIGTLWFLGFFMQFLYLIPGIWFIVIIQYQNDIIKLSPELTFINVLVSYTLYTLALCSQMFFLSSFFKDPKMASDLLGILNIFFSFLWIFQYSETIQNQTILQILFYLFPQVKQQKIYFIIKCAINQAWFSKGWFLRHNYAYLMPFTGCLIALILDIILYLLGKVFQITHHQAYIYFDQILPNDYGTNKHPCFIFTFWKKKANYQVFQDDQQLELAPQQFPQELLMEQDNSNAYFQEEIANKDSLKKAIKISNLQKSFNNITAVNNLTLDLYHSEIFCLLGHNGAGKTTTINLLTGMLTKDRGRIQICGLDIDADLNLIRQQIGLCSQKDILYDDLTVAEHLKFYGRIKMQNNDEITAQMNLIAEKCLLTTELHKKASQLSGGNKRKLSLAISLMGQAKVIFLDEPSSGLDPVARASLWEILKEIKKDRCIILTTHHLEEAEELADRIGIMQSGNLFVLGSVDFIKRKFGVGYLLSLEFKDEIQLKAQKDMIAQELKSIAQIEVEGLKINAVLPFEQQRNFQTLFKTLEKTGAQISLEMNSLEDAFINIGLDQHRIQLGQQYEQAIDVDAVNQHQLDYSPQYVFTTQISAMMLRKYLLTKNLTSVLGYVMPWLFNLIGILLGTLVQQKEVKLVYFIIFFILSKTFQTSNFILIPVQEKEYRIKHQLLAFGQRIFPYWLGTLLFDSIIVGIYLCFPQRFILAIESVVLVLLCVIYDIGLLDDKWYWTGLLIFLFGTALNCFTYFMSLFYQKSSSAFITFPIFTLLIYLSAGLILYSSIWKERQSFAFEALLYGVNILFCFNSLITGYVVIQNKEEDNDILGGIYGIFCILIASSIFYMTLTLLIDKKQQIKRSALNTLDNSAIETRNLSKQYENQFQAVKEISFDVKNNEIFGLLGPNGAGKSTTFSMLTRFIEPTSGLISIKNEETQVGIIPQFSPLYQNLSIKDHFQIFGLIKGVSKEVLQSEIEFYLKELKLETFANRKVDVLSGGEKRKVQLGMCLIGGSSKLFMDEPSSGLDPMARKTLQDILLKSLKVE